MVNAQAVVRGSEEESEANPTVTTTITADRSFSVDKGTESNTAMKTTTGTDPEEKKKTKAELAALKKIRKRRVNQLLELCKPYKFQFIAGLCSSAILGSNQPMFAVLLGWILHTYNLPSNEELMHNASLVGLFFFAMGVLAFVGRFINVAMFTTIRTNVIKELRLKLFKAVLHQNIGWFELPGNSTGEIILLMGKELAEIRHLIGDLAAQKLECFFALTVGMSIALYSSWQLTLVIIGCAPLLVLGTAIQHGNWINQGKKRNLNDNSTDIFLESVRLIRTVAAFGLHKNRMKSFEEKSLITYHQKVRACMVDAVGFAFSSSIQYMIYGIAFWYAGILNAQQGMCGVMVCGAMVLVLLLVCW